MDEAGPAPTADDDEWQEETLTHENKMDCGEQLGLPQKACEAIAAFNAHLDSFATPAEFSHDPDMDAQSLDSPHSSAEDTYYQPNTDLGSESAFVAPSTVEVEPLLTPSLPSIADVMEQGGGNRTKRTHSGAHKHGENGDLSDPEFLPEVATGLCSALVGENQKGGPSFIKRWAVVLAQAPMQLRPILGRWFSQLNQAMFLRLNKAVHDTILKKGRRPASSSFDFVGDKLATGVGHPKQPVRNLASKLKAILAFQVYHNGAWRSVKTNDPPFETCLHFELLNLIRITHIPSDPRLADVIPDDLREFLSANFYSNLVKLFNSVLAGNLDEVTAEIGADLPAPRPPRVHGKKRAGRASLQPTFGVMLPSVSDPTAFTTDPLALVIVHHHRLGTQRPFVVTRQELSDNSPRSFAKAVLGDNVKASDPISSKYVDVRMNLSGRFFNPTAADAKEEGHLVINVGMAASAEAQTDTDSDTDSEDVDLLDPLDTARTSCRGHVSKRGRTEGLESNEEEVIIVSDTSDNDEIDDDRSARIPFGSASDQVRVKTEPGMEIPQPLTPAEEMAVDEEAQHNSPAKEVAEPGQSMEISTEQVNDEQLGQHSDAAAATPTPQPSRRHSQRQARAAVNVAAFNIGNISIDRLIKKEGSAHGKHSVPAEESPRRLKSHRKIGQTAVTEPKPAEYATEPHSRGSSGFGGAPNTFFPSHGHCAEVHHFAMGMSAPAVAVHTARRIKKEKDPTVSHSATPRPRRTTRRMKSTVTRGAKVATQSKAEMDQIIAEQARAGRKNRELFSEAGEAPQGINSMDQVETSQMDEVKTHQMDEHQFEPNRDETAQIESRLADVDLSDAVDKVQAEARRAMAEAEWAMKAEEARIEAERLRAAEQERQAEEQRRQNEKKRKQEELEERRICLTDRREHLLEHSKKENFYQFLGVPRSATSQEIRAAGRKLLLLHHPDKHQQDGQLEVAQELTRKVLEALAVLMEPNARKEYDQLIDTHTGWISTERFRAYFKQRDNTFWGKLGLIIVDAAEGIIAKVIELNIGGALMHAATMPMLALTASSAPPIQLDEEHCEEEELALHAISEEPLDLDPNRFTFSFGADLYWHRENCEMVIRGRDGGTERFGPGRVVTREPHDAPYTVWFERSGHVVSHVMTEEGREPLPNEGVFKYDTIVTRKFQMGCTWLSELFLHPVLDGDGNEKRDWKV